MTRTGCICMIVIMALAAVGILLGRLKNREKDFSTSLRCARNDRRANAGAGLPTVTGEPVVFRRAELRLVTCKASMEIGPDRMEERGFDPRNPEHWPKADKYYKEELACRLMDQVLESGGICFEHSGDALRARLRVVLPEEGAGDGTEN